VREEQRTLLSFCICVLRYLQDERRIVDPRMERTFSAAGVFSRKARPGFISGFGRNHFPQSSSWASDAKAWWVHVKRIGGQ
jgi:hypothetical protein